MTPASARLRWAAEVAAPRPGDRELEVGCGHGVLLGPLADRVTEGLVVGLDRSPTTTAAASARNREAVAAGRVRLPTAAPLDADLDLDGGAFDRGGGAGHAVRARGAVRAGRGHPVAAVDRRRTGARGRVARDGRL